MNFTGSPVQIAIVTASAMLAGVIGVLATLRRGHWLVTLLFSSAFLSMAAFQAGTLGILRADSAASARTWATYLAGISALASWLWLTLSVILARPHPLHQLRNAAAYLTLALIGCVVLFVVAGTRYVVEEVVGSGGATMLVMGAMGKIYLMYLVVVMMAVLMNLESMVRSGPVESQRRLRALFVALVIGLLAELLVVSAGLLHGGIRVAWLGASAAPMFASGVITALTLARRRLSDMSVPIARPVVYYSSVSLTLAGGFLLSMAALSRLIPILSPEWKRLVTWILYLAVGGGGLMITFSPRATRAVKRFIDRNFYANRYDYRREWDRVSRAIVPSGRPDDICRQVESLVRSVFDVERVLIHLKDERSGRFHTALLPLPASEVFSLPLAADNPLLLELDRLREPLVLRDVSQDLDLIPALVENRVLIQALPAAVCAPLHVGESLIGLLWLSEKRTDEPYSFEDVEFLGAMSRQLAAALWFARLSEQLAETRQLESLNRLSSYVLHDVKNQVSGLSLVAENARQHLADPQFQRDAMRVLERTVGNLKQLIGRVSSVSRPPVVRAGPIQVESLVKDAIAVSGLVEGERDGVRLRVRRQGGSEAHGDQDQVMRGVTNLLVNAREALRGTGTIELEVKVGAMPGDGPGSLTIAVSDDGIGMTPTFVRESLYRPFSTTKPEGLGVGLVHTRAMVEAHGGTMTVESEPGRGTRFEIRLPGPPAVAQRKASA